MNAVMGVGAPWYTSGVQVWNGTAATLKPSPTSSSANPATKVPVSNSVFCERKREIPVSDVVPVAPYTSAMPYRKIADENAPSTKYLMPASCELNRRRSKAESTYKGIDNTSSARNTTMRLLAVVMMTM